MEQPWMIRIKWLTQALIISGALNIGLLATFIAFLFKEKEPYALRPISSISEKQPTNIALLRSYCTLPFQDLLLRLENQDLAEDGYTRRDLALACLVSFHHFNLDRALGTKIFPRRLIGFTDSQGLERIEIPIFQGLSDFQFQAILHYAKTEKWPFTTKGLFYELKKGSHLKDPSLIEAFSLAPEYDILSALFAKTDTPISRDQLIRLISEGEWETLAESTAVQKQAIDLSPTSRRNFLLSYLNFRSSLAADIFLNVDAEYALKRFDDAQLLVLLSLISADHPQLESFAKQLLLSQRSDSIWKKSSEILYTKAKESIPVSFDPVVAIRKFCPEAVPVLPVLEPSLPIPSISSVEPKQLHTIQDGDSLWKIARKYHVSIEALMEANHLDTERLRAGKQLKIPQKKN